MNDDERKNLGPLAALVGVWGGQPGVDVAPGATREPAETLFSERMSFEFLGAVDNHEQQLWGLRYRTEVTRLSDGAGFHEEVGYWLWDAAHGQVMRAFVVPRGVAVLAGGPAAPDARTFSIEAVRGAPVYGISTNAFVDEAFRIERFTATMKLHLDGELRYDEDTVLRMPGREELFHHRDGCSLRRLEG